MSFPATILPRRVRRCSSLSRLFFVLYTLVLFGMPGCALHRPSGGVGGESAPSPHLPVFEAATGGRVGEAALVGALTATDVVLLGESHDHPEHHRIQARLIEAIASRVPVTAVAFEMLDERHLAALSTWQRSEEQTLDALARAVEWEDSGWPDFELYAPVFAAALRSKARIIPLNLSRGALGCLTGAGEATVSTPVDACAAWAESRWAAPVVAEQTLGAPAGQILEAMPNHLLAEVAADLRVAHCGHGSDAGLRRMARKQWLRDAWMAGRIALAADPRHGSGEQAGRTERGVVIVIAGRGHARRDRGIPIHLQRVAPDLNVVAVGMLEASGSIPGESGPTLFDYVWTTPAIERPDPCEGFTLG